MILNIIYCDNFIQLKTCLKNETDYATDIGLRVMEVVNSGMTSVNL